MGEISIWAVPLLGVLLLTLAGKLGGPEMAAAAVAAIAGSCVGAGVFALVRRTQGRALLSVAVGLLVTLLTLGTGLLWIHRSSSSLAVAPPPPSSKGLTADRLKAMDLRGADLRGADLSSANLVKRHLEGADLRGANLTRAQLSESHLEGANLSGATMVQTCLRGAFLHGAELDGVDADHADVSDAQLPRDAATAAFRWPRTADPSACSGR